MDIFSIQLDHLKESVVPVSSADAGSVLRSGTADFNEIEDRCAIANIIIVYGIDESKSKELKKKIWHDEVLQLF